MVKGEEYKEKIFIKQLKIIGIENSTRILVPDLKNYYRAFEHRSQWVRNDLLLVGELSRYEYRLVEEWEIIFAQMRDEIGDSATDELKKMAGQKLYKWIENGNLKPIRQGFTEDSIARVYIRCYQKRRKLDGIQILVAS